MFFLYSAETHRHVNRCHRPLYLLTYLLTHAPVTAEADTDTGVGNYYRYLSDTQCRPDYLYSYSALYSALIASSSVSRSANIHAG